MIELLPITGLVFALTLIGVLAAALLIQRRRR